MNVGKIFFPEESYIELYFKESYTSEVLENRKYIAYIDGIHQSTLGTEITNAIAGLKDSEHTLLL